MTATTLTPVPTAAATGRSGPLAELEELRRSVRELGETLSQLHWTDPRLRALGATVSAVADLVRRSVGGPQAIAESADLAPIVRLRDLAVAGRQLLGRNVVLTDSAAAQDARAHCARILMALA